MVQAEPLMYLALAVAPVGVLPLKPQAMPLMSLAPAVAPVGVLTSMAQAVPSMSLGPVLESALPLNCSDLAPLT